MCLLLVALELKAGPLTWTGDEPRYVYQALGLYTNHAFYPTATVWETFLKANGFSPEAFPYMGRSSAPLQVLSTSVLFGWILSAFGLEAARWADLTIACLALFVLFACLRAQSRNVPAASLCALSAVCTIALALPFFAYLKTLYPEILLFAVVTGALWSLLRPGPLYLTVTLTVVMPFVHTRALPLAIAFAGVLLYREFQAKQPPRVLVTTALFCAFGFGAFAATQLALFGTLSGISSVSYNPSLFALPERIGMNLYDVRHGALAYSPIFLLGFAGLFAGLLRRDRDCTQSALLFGVYLGTFIWATAGESWGARYWVAALPFVAFGTSYWLQRCTRWTDLLAVVPLGLLTLTSLGLFVHQPVWFLESRIASVPYAVLFRLTGFHFGLLFPADGNAGPVYDGQIPILLAGTVIIVGLLVSIVAARTQTARLLASGGALAVVLVAVASTRAVSLPRDAYTLTVDPLKYSITVRFDSPERIDAVQFDDKLPIYWNAVSFPTTFRVVCSAGDRVLAESQQPASPFVVLRDCSNANQLEISAIPPSGDRQLFQTLGTVRLIRRDL